MVDEPNDEKHEIDDTVEFDEGEVGPAGEKKPKSVGDEGEQDAGEDGNNGDDDEKGDKPSSRMPSTVIIDTVHLDDDPDIEDSVKSNSNLTAEFETVDPSSKTVLLDTDPGQGKIGPSVELAGPVQLDDGADNDSGESTIEIEEGAMDDASGTLKLESGVDPNATVEVDSSAGPDDTVTVEIDSDSSAESDQAGMAGKVELESTSDAGERTVDIDGLAADSLDSAGSNDAGSNDAGSNDATVDIESVSGQETLDPDVDMTIDGIDGGSAPKTVAIDATVNVNPPDASKTVQGGATLEAGEDRLLVDWSSMDRTQLNHSQTIRGVEHESGGKRTNLVIQARSLVESNLEEGHVADYQLLEQLGKGGMGMVYAARQASIDRKVAVKKMLPRVANQPVQREKFLAEAVVTGELDHPSIVPIYDLGTDSQGALFYSMKCVEGTPWSDVIYKKPLAENLDILDKSADALAFAHSRGVIHRDLKPENIMLGDYGEVLVMDWGLAMPANSSSKRSLGGTPAYMAPEMALGPSNLISPASDIYLFGAMLFEILAKKPPHTGDNVMMCLQAAARNEIVSTSVGGELMEIAMKAMASEPTDRHASMLEFQEEIRDYKNHAESIALVHRADGRLAEAIKSTDYQDFAQAMFSYEEALQFWEGNEEAQIGLVNARLAYAGAALEKGDYDLGLSLLDSEAEHHAELRGKLLVARSVRDSHQRRLKRSRTMIAALVTLLLVAISIGLFFVNQQRHRAERNADVARSNEKAAKRSEANARAQEKRADREADIARENETKAIDEGKRADQKADEALESARVAEERRMEAVEERGKAEVATKLAEKRETEAKTARDLAEMRKTEAENAQKREQREAYVARIGLAAAKIAENSFTQAQTILDECPKEFRSWEWGRLNRLANQSLNTLKTSNPLEAVAFSPQSNRVAVGGWKGSCQISSYDANTGVLTPQRSLDIPSGFINDLAFSHDGKHLITAGSQSAGFVTVWDVESGEQVAKLEGHVDSVTGIAVSSDGQRMLTCSLDHSVKLWDAQTYTLLRTYVGHTWWVWDVAFLPGGASAVSAGQDGAINVWDLESGERHAFQEHRRPIYALAVANDGRVASGDSDGRILLWRSSDVDQVDAGSRFTSNGDVRTPFVELAGHSAAVRSLSFSLTNSDSAIDASAETSSEQAASADMRLVSAADDNTLRVFDLQGRPKLWKEIRGHGGRVRACVVLERGGRILSASHDSTVKVWNLDGYQEQRVFQRLAGHDGAVLAATFAPNGDVFSASQDRTVAGWATKTGKLDRQLREGHSFLASNTEIYAKGTRMVTAAGDRTVRGWEIATGSQLFELSNTGIGAVATVSSDEQWLLTGGPDHIIQIWELAKLSENGKPVQFLAGHKGDVTSIDFSADGRWLVSGDDRGLVLVWDWSNRTLVSKVAEHTSRINAIEVIGADKFAVASNDRTAAIWSLPNGDEIAVYPHDSPVSDLAWSESRSELLTISEKGVVRSFAGESREPTARATPQAGSLSSVAVSPDGNSVAIVDDEENSVLILNRDDLNAPPLQVLRVAEMGGAVWSVTFLGNQRVVTVGGDDARVWDLLSGEISMTFGPQGVVSSVDVSPDGRFLVSANWERTAKVWDLETNKTVQTLGHENAGDLEPHEGVIYAARFTSDGRQIVTAGRDGTIRWWDSKTGRVLRVVDAHKGPIWALEIAPKEKNWVASAGGDGRVAIWNLADGSLVAEQSAHDNGVRAVAFSSDATRLATGGDDRFARVWEIQGGKFRLIANVEGHSAPVVGVDFHPNENRLLTGGEDGIAKIWNLSLQNDQENAAEKIEPAQELLSLTGHRGGVTSVTFSHDGSAVLTSSRDGQLILWQADGWQDEGESAGTR